MDLNTLIDLIAEQVAREVVETSRQAADAVSAWLRRLGAAAQDTA